MLFINLISLYLLAVTVAGVFCAVQVRALNSSDYSKTTLWLCYAICFYILAYAMELHAVTPSDILFWNRIEYIGIPFVSALWLTTALQYTGHFTRHKVVLILAIYVIPFITFILRQTNSFHHLYFASERFTVEFQRLIYMKHAGPWMYVQLIHSMLMIFSAMALFIYDALKNAEKQAGKVLLIGATSFFAITGLILTQLKPFGLQIDYMALCLPLTCIMAILAILRYDLLETKSIARGKVFEASSDAILMLNCQYRIVDYNTSARELFEQIGIRLSSRDVSTLFSKNADLFEGFQKAESSVVKLKIKSEERYFEITTENIDEQNTLRGLIKIVRDVTEIYRLNGELKIKALTDELSTLSNRRAFIEISEKWIQNAEETGTSLYLLMLDLDHFKNVNDQYGHPAGDLVIREFAQLLTTNFDSKSQIARLGGEEFAVLLSDLTDDEVLQKTKSLLDVATGHTYIYFGQQFNVTVSIGVTKKLPEQNLESLMRKADRALYQSKEMGRSRYTQL